MCFDLDIEDQAIKLEMFNSPLDSFTQKTYPYVIIKNYNLQKCREWYPPTLGPFMLVEYPGNRGLNHFLPDIFCNFSPSHFFNLGLVTIELG